MVWIVRFPSPPPLIDDGASLLSGEIEMQEPKSWSPKPEKAVHASPIARFDAGLDVTRRQLECLAWVAEGKSAIEIGIILGISDRTVEKHIAKICGVFGVSRRIQAVDYARRLGLIASE